MSWEGLAGMPGMVAFSTLAFTTGVIVRLTVEVALISTEASSNIMSPVAAIAATAPATPTATPTCAVTEAAAKAIEACAIIPLVVAAAAVAPVAVVPATVDVAADCEAETAICCVTA